MEFQHILRHFQEISPNHHLNVHKLYFCLLRFFIPLLYYIRWLRISSRFLYGSVNATLRSVLVAIETVLVPFVTNLYSLILFHDF